MALYTVRRRAPFSLALKGIPSLAEPLGAALWAQWSYGFPIVPSQHGMQLTHGFLHYPAGMQPLAAHHMLTLLPSGVLLDPFVGGGTTLVEALRGGRHLSPIGADLSPLAIFASAHHLWPASDSELAQLRAQARTALQVAGQLGEGVPASDAEPLGRSPRRSGDKAHTVRIGGLLLERDRGGAGKGTWRKWEELRAEIERLTADADTPAGGAATPAPLWFCLAAAQQRSVRYRLSCPLASFEATVLAYEAAVRELRAALPLTPPLPLPPLAPPLPPPPAQPPAQPARLLLGDARSLSLEARGLPLADAVLTSPPYAAVYDYLSYARGERARLCARGRGGGGDGGSGDGGGNDCGDSGDGGGGDGGSGQGGAAAAAMVMGVRGTPAARGEWPEAWSSAREIGARKVSLEAMH